VILLLELVEIQSLVVMILIHVWMILVLMVHAFIPPIVLPLPIFVFPSHVIQKLVLVIVQFSHVRNHQDVNKQVAILPLDVGPN